MSKPSMKPLRWMICGVLLGGASLAWPCAGEVCRRDPQLASIDGGVPSNFPLLLTDLWDATRYTPGELCLLLTVLGFVRRRGLR